MASYTCADVTLAGGETAVRLEDGSAGLDATVIPARGAIWSAFGALDAAGRRVELLTGGDDLDAPGRSPVLFPAVGRSWCDGQLGAYRHGGVVRPMDIHGFAKDLPWAVAAAGADAESAYVTCALSDTEATRRIYPYPFQLSLTYRLHGGALRIEAAVENPGAEAMPFHLGYHPYFRMPVLPGGDRRRCLLDLPAASAWALENLIATGERVPLAAGESYLPARPLGDVSLDRAFADLQADPTSGLAATGVRDPDSGWGVRLEHDPAAFPVFVVYAPAGGAPANTADEPFVCLEPWAGLPGGLGDDTPAGRAARRLAPGAVFEAVVSVRVERP